MDYNEALASTKEGFDSVKALLVKELAKLRKIGFMASKTPEELFVFLFSSGLHCNTFFIVSNEETKKVWLEAFSKIAEENNLDPDEIILKHYEGLMGN